MPVQTCRANAATKSPRPYPESILPFLLFGTVLKGMWGKTQRQHFPALSRCARFLISCCWYSSRDTQEESSYLTTLADSFKTIWTFRSLTCYHLVLVRGFYIQSIYNSIKFSRIPGGVAHTDLCVTKLQLASFCGAKHRFRHFNTRVCLFNNIWTQQVNKIQPCSRPQTVLPSLRPFPNSR